jgi:hypothetical protein
MAGQRSAHGGIMCVWWNSRPLPTVGGGQPPGMAARWIVQRAYSEVSPKPLATCLDNTGRTGSTIGLSADVACAIMRITLH